VVVQVVPLVLEVKVEKDVWRWMPALKQALKDYGGPFGVMPDIPAKLPPMFISWAQDDAVALTPILKFYDALRVGDRAAIARLVNTGNVNLPMVMPNGNVSPQTPISGALQHCGLPQVASAKVASVVAQLVALGADVELRSPSGSTALDYAKAACPDDVQQALLGKTLRQ